VKLLNTEFASLVKYYSRQDAYLELMQKWKPKMVAGYEYGEINSPDVVIRREAATAGAETAPESQNSSQETDMEGVST
jgi:hypothetical protein